MNDFSLVPTDIATIKTDLCQVTERLATLEPRIVVAETRLTAVEAKLNSLTPGPSSVENVVEEVRDRELRSFNVILHGIPEGKSKTSAERIKHDHDSINKILEALCKTNSSKSFKFFRIGRATQGKIRPLKVIFKNKSDVSDLFNNFDLNILLNIDSDFFRDASISRDRTALEREHLSKLRAELKNRTDAGEDGLTIKYRGGVPKIVKTVQKNA
jgi:hypothetical protein